MKVNQFVLLTILNNTKKSLRYWSACTQLSVATLSDWKNGKHIPREDSLDILLECMDRDLDDEQKRRQYEEIVKAMGIDERSSLGQRILEKFNRNAKEFWKYMLLEYDRTDNYYSDFLHVDFCLVDEIIGEKLGRWLNYSESISCRCLKTGEETAFWISLKNKEMELTPAVFNYRYILADAGDMIKILKKQAPQRKGDVCRRIYFTVKEVSNEEYERLLLEYGIYLKQISQEDMKPRRVNDGYVTIDSEIETKTMQKLNAVADVLFRQIIDSFYLVYKELVCSQYNFDNVNEEFFRTNAGIGTYPYTIRRAISFEKNFIESFLKERTEKGKKKLGLVMDLNCMGGIYGMRLSQYASEVLCVDTSEMVLNTIQETVRRYNERKNSQNPGITNIGTALMRVGTYEILCNRKLKEKADCIILGLGSMSLACYPDLILKKLKDWLKKDGCILISCYNANALSILLKRYDNLNYWYDFNSKRLIYRRGKIEFPIPVRMYSFCEMIQLISKYYEVNEDTCRSYPIISSILSVEQYQPGMNVIKEVDKASALYNHQKLAYGNYNMLEAVNYQSESIENTCLISCEEVSDI